ncbi:MAG: major facilitator superfamily 1 [Panacagrimonas sp.]|jgi:MFS family permease|nr:MFS transporter [Panacagrimonas sp.]MCC2658256.1 major facilitator superfamily 1 [Panacagrimonas sp.]
MTAPVEAPVPKRILPVLVLAQLAGTSTWFAVNAVMPSLQAEFGWEASAVGTLTSAVQLGFISGALVLALLSIADRFSARRVFLFASIAQALCTLIAVAVAESFAALCVWRFLTGFLLAGIYPVGMKIASQWFPRGLGHALGLLIGALVLGSAFPHALRGAAVGWPWHHVFYAVAGIAAAAGVVLVMLIPEPPGNVARPSGLQFRALWAVAGERRVRASVLGYFGHMWELYTLWVLMPMILATRLSDPVTISWSAFVSLGMGAAGCAVGGWIATRTGSAPVAGAMLTVSGLCCFIAPWALDAPLFVFGAWLVVWGFSISGDSPQFSALTARNSPPALVGSVLTLTNSIGFAISILSIQLFVWLAQTYPLAQLIPWMGIGPVLGVWALWPLLREEAQH